jgi:DNA invertase Pin-like site-specific DNA recombinase
MCQNVISLILKYGNSYNNLLKHIPTIIEIQPSRRSSTIKVGYIRVSSKDQNEARQVEALQALGIERLYIGKVSGKNTNRAQLKEMLAYVREGDSVYIESISRLARNTLDFLTMVKEFTERGITVVSLKETLDTSTPQGKFMLTVFGALYELERDSIKERQAEGIAVAQRKGTLFGRPKQDVTEGFKEVYDEWKAGSLTGVDAMKRVGMKPNTFYRRVKEYESAQG